MYIAHLLSRSSIKTPSRSVEEIEHIHCLDLIIPMSESRLSEFKDATKSDPTLIGVRNFGENGWPISDKELTKDCELATFFESQNQLVFKEGLIF